MKKLIVFLAVTLLTATTVQADAGQYGQYGQYGPYKGGSSTSIMVDKTVSRALTTKGGITAYVDNNSPTDTRFAPGATVYFQVKVKNTSNVTLNNVEVSDIMPNEIIAVEGPGTYNENSKTITWKYDSLKAGEEKTEKIIAQIKGQNQLPADKGVMCMINKSTVRAGNNYDDDTAQFCVEKQVIGAKQVPTAGPEYGILLTTLSFASLGAGVYLKRKI